MIWKNNLKEGLMNAFSLILIFITIGLVFALLLGGIFSVRYRYINDKHQKAISYSMSLFNDKSREIIDLTKMEKIGKGYNRLFDTKYDIYIEPLSHNKYIIYYK